LISGRETLGVLIIK